MRALKNIGAGIRGGLEGIVGQLGQLHGQMGGISRKAMITICLLGAAAISIGTCATAQQANGNNFPEYHFNGNLDSEHVIFHENAHNRFSSVVVQKPGDSSSGRIVRYVLLEGSGPDHTLVLEKVVITESDGWALYNPDSPRQEVFRADSPNQEVRRFVETARHDVDKYLRGIIAAKTRLYNPQAQPTQKGDWK